MGFDACDPHGSAYYFDLLTPGGAYFNTIIPGKGAGNGVFQTNANSLFTRIFDPQTFWVVGFDLWIGLSDGSSTPADHDRFFQLANAAGPILSIEVQASGKLAVFYGGSSTPGSGTLQALAAVAWPTTGWGGYLEFKAHGFGGSVTWEIWVNDVLYLNGTTATFPVDVPDRVVIGHNSTAPPDLPGVGSGFDNVYMLDAQGPAPYNDRLGPVRIATVMPFEDASGNWNITSTIGPLTDRYSAVDDYYGDPNGAPDLQKTYISPVALNTLQLFVFQPPPCFGRILGVNVNQCFQGSSGSTTCDAMLLNQSLLTNVGTSVVNGSWHTTQQFIGLSPSSGTWFTAAEIGGAFWGARTSSPALELTQMFIEVVTSLRSTPYDCGASSYSF